VRRSLLVIVFAILSLPTSALSQTDNACWNRDVERMDFFQNPPEGGDNNFFTGVVVNSSTTNVTLLYPTKATMIDFFQKLYRIRVDLGGASPTGCSNDYLNNVRYFMPTSIQPPAGAASLQGVYKKTNTYPDPGPTYSGGSGQSDGLSNGSFYRYRNWGANGAGIVPETAVNACINALTPFGYTLSTDPYVLACVQCVSNSGYWLNPLARNNDILPEAGVFSGNWLRFYPPKWTLLSLAYKRLVNGPLLSVLREGVVASNGSTGGQVVQKMLPQSCQGTGRPMNQKLAAIDSLNYTGNANPLAEMLFNTAWFMGGQNNPWVFSNPAIQGGAPMSNGSSGPCASCTGDFIVLFSDGRGDTANPACTADALGNIPPQCTAAAQCSTLGMGAEGDGDDFLDPSIAGGAGMAISGASVRQTPTGTCDMDLADDVALWMANNNVGSASLPETVRTYVVAIGDPYNTYNELTSLQIIAANGQGRYLVADNFVDLEANIEQVMNAIINRATSFSSAAIATVQTHGYTSAFIPRFTPNGGAQWHGTLTRFSLFNEFAAGCTSADYGAVDALNPNGNNSCYDVYLTDKNNKIIEEVNGQFVVANTSQAWDGGWPPLSSADGGYVPAVPVWEAASLLAAREDSVLAGATSNARRIFTVAPNGTSGSYSSTLVPFTVANVSNITPSLKLGGVNGDFCTSLGYRTRHAYVTEDDCATDVIRFMQGEDVLFQNPYNRTNPQPAYYHSRPHILGDIFHSTPVLVTPPAPTYLCDIGIVNQCVGSLYSPTLEPNGQSAYQTYFTNNQYRTEFVLVGGNDGMIHAFNAGNDTVTGSVHTFDNGTGQEMWAFIPPDMLPKLIRYMTGERHELLMDGTAMVRDIWVDGSGSTSADHQKQYDEFHTVAVIGEREGGRHWTALDVTDPMNPRFLWVSQPPGTTEDLKAGGSWDDLGPAPGPIGPIAEYDSAGLFSVNGTPARERYVFAAGGGYDPAYLRGRSFHVFDAWTGQELWRYSRADSSGGSDPRNSLSPIAAPPSLLDTDGDGIFDTAVVGDVHGQVWTFSLSNPGVTGASGRYNNWYGGRAFIQYNGQGFYKRSPFFQRAAATFLPNGAIRVYLGSGDRDQIKDPNGGTCGLPNLEACLRKNCSVSVSTNEYRVGSAPSGGSSGHYFNANWSYSAGATSESTNWDVDNLGQGEDCSDVDDSNLSYAITCGGGRAVNFSSAVYCDWGAGMDGGSECPVGEGRPFGTQVPYTPPSGTIQSSNFYSFRLFDSAQRAQFTTASQANQYDNYALTETNLVNATDGGTSSPTDNGYYVTHTNSAADEKTASSALVLGGCALWNTLVANPDGGLIGCGVGASLPLDTAYAYQADVVSGAVSCGQAGSSTYTATARYIPHSTYVAPEQPALVVSINSRTGQVAYSGISIDPGSPPASTTVGSREVSGTIHWLEVPRKVHECRHNGVNCN